MGNRLGRKKELVEDRYTRPQGLYQHRDIDHKKLRKLILDSKLAPCYPGIEDASVVPDLEECPICFLHYPSLNRSRCCFKGICTECFLQMKLPHSTRPTQCPFCKTPNYAVEYRGVRTNEEKGKEQIEEQKVIEAKIRMQQQELHEEEERLHKKQAAYLTSRMTTPGDVEYRDMPTNSLSVPSYKCAVQSEELISSSTSHACLSSRQPPSSRHNRENEFDLDLEELMVMEAIWLSILDHGNDGVSNNISPSAEAPSSSDHYASSCRAIPAESSSSTGLVSAAAAVAEHQHFNEGPATLNGESSFTFETLPVSGSLSTGDMGDYAPGNWTQASHNDGRAARSNETEWRMDMRTLDNELEAAASTSYAGCDGNVDRGGTSLQVPGGMNMAGGHLVPETYEEQMMLAMAVSLAEARARVNTQGVTWM